MITFASPDAVRPTYFRLFLFVVMGILAGVVGLHASQAHHAGRLERWGFRASLVGMLLLTIGAFSGYWSPLRDFSFVLPAQPSTLYRSRRLLASVPAQSLATW